MKQAIKRAVPDVMLRAHHARLARRAVTGFEPRRATHRYDGRELTLEFRDGLAEAWYDRDCDAPPEYDLLPKLREGALVFDLGAHQGMIALMLAGRVGPKGHVVAVEADPHNAHMAEVNRDLNGVKNMTVVHAAASDTYGEVRFAANLNGHIDGSKVGTVSVPAVTVDSLAERYGHPHVVILDVEGFEQRVLEGAFRTLAQRPNWSVEVHGARAQARCGGDPAQVVGMLSGYALSASTGNGFTPVTDIPATRFWLVAT